MGHLKRNLHFPLFPHVSAGQAGHSWPSRVGRGQVGADVRVTAPDAHHCEEAGRVPQVEELRAPDLRLHPPGKRWCVEGAVRAVGACPKGPTTS